ncbi:N-(5'-phosphoribosyl)anthranilate isomerase [Saccharibacter sp. 17.LH.SD]|uniref:phosphoribosylanthranilate isomerase n=1 Tax=Saccharibacter sp. 17.LH.SD TaxID=2689393 RepID=UPI001371C277|nr:phosphoribosylanthranilate isomerase [Saccharibacter sp. 17.LH.SD]MXV43537.1 N-(5'-phosphoribosyl)anthranilate isomerase [Saccharibacter sp. 17.LH.SD]
MTEIKICGLTRPQDVQLCAELEVTWVGFVFYPPSPRSISAEQAALLHQTIPTAQQGGPSRVGLFVKPTLEMINDVLAHVPLDVLQLYTTPDIAQQIKQQTGLPVWLARGIKTASDLPTQASTLDRFIIEAPADEHDTRPGGLGKRFDWSLTQGWNAPLPWLLAGGLNAHNVQQAIATSKATAVDVSSGVESHPGHKSPELLKNFVKNAHAGGCLSTGE